MLRSFLLYLSERQTPKRFLTHSSLGGRFASRFIAGEELPQAVDVVRQLNAAGFDATLDHLGESVMNAAAAEDACRVYAQILDRLAAEGLRSHVSIKLTQLGLAIDEDLALRLLVRIAGHAAEQHNFVRIDMENSVYVDSTLRVFAAARAPRDVLGVVIQAYLHRSGNDIQHLIACGARVRLVKGAYNEPPEVAYPHKQDVEASFARLMKKLLASGGYHAIATHDPRLIEATLRFARQQGLGPDQFEFQMLYGIQRQLQRELLRQGFRVRIYVPYGHQWYPYFMRRLAERPANVLFLMRSLLRR
jgi:proline dehydrogenase